MARTIRADVPPNRGSCWERMKRELRRAALIVVVQAIKVRGRCDRAGRVRDGSRDG